MKAGPAKSEVGSRKSEVPDRQPKAVQGLAERTTAFAVAAIQVSRGFGRDYASGVIARQFLRSATSVGAHYREARRSRSRAEFLSKLEVALQELDETAYWIEIAIRAGLKSAGLDPLRAETNELLAILAAATRTTKEAP